mgnify:CR=1 FL=1
MKTSRLCLKNCQGFTLVEVILASSILLLLIAVSGGILLSSLGGFSRVAAMGEAKQLGLAVYSFYQHRLTVAKTVSLGTGAAGEDQYLEVVDATGRLRYNNEELYGEEAYHGLRLQTSQWVEEKDYLLYLTVTVWRDEDGNGVCDEGEALFIKDGAFRINNLERNKDKPGVEPKYKSISNPRPEDDPQINGAIYYQEAQAVTL